MKKCLGLLGLLFLLLWPHLAAAQTTKVVGTCGAQTYAAGTMQYPTQDSTGAACGNIVVTASPTGGDTTYSYPGGTGNALITNTAVLVVAGAHSLMQGSDFWNTGNATCWIQVFDAASTGSVTLGTTPPLRVWGVPAGGSNTVETSVEGIKFVNGVVIAATSTQTGAGACNSAQTVNIQIK